MGNAIVPFTALDASAVVAKALVDAGIVEDVSIEIEARSVSVRAQPSFRRGLPSRSPTAARVSIRQRALWSAYLQDRIASARDHCRASAAEISNRRAWIHAVRSTLVPQDSGVG